jgi:hypothetical protein
VGVFDDPRWAKEKGAMHRISPQASVDMRSISICGCLFGCGLVAAACSSTSGDSGDSGRGAVVAATSATMSASASAGPNTLVGDGGIAPDAGDFADAGDGGASKGAAGGLDVSGLDPDKPLYDTKADLQAFVEVMNPGSLRKRWKDPLELLDQTFGVGSVWFSNQGNTAISHPTGSRKQCIKGF